MKILSWNVSGLRDRLKNEIDGSYNNNLNRALFSQICNKSGHYHTFSIVCLQDTRCTANQVKLPVEITVRYRYRYWNSSGRTAIWSYRPPISIIPRFEYDKEERVIALEFKEFVLVSVCIPTSEEFEKEQYYPRETWNNNFMTSINELKSRYKKDIIICGSVDITHTSVGACYPKEESDRVPYSLNSERHDFATLVEPHNIVDIFRYLSPNEQWSTYWPKLLKTPRSKENGWILDYFLVSEELVKKNKIIDYGTLMNLMGSDHCPLYMYIK
jgi:exodeoxyribonuclease-3